MGSTTESLGVVGAGAIGKRSLAEQFQSVRQASMRCCSPLKVEDHSLQAMPDASPAKWHLAHTTWFFETFLLSEHLLGYKPANPAFRTLFNSYYNAVGDRPLRAMRHVLSRPSLEEVHSYRAHVDEAMEQLLLARDFSPDVADLVALGLNHEQQHQELILTDVKYGLAANPLRPAYRERHSTPSDSEGDAPELTWFSFAKGIYPIGFEGDGFCYDNELPRHNVYLEPFRLASRLVTNGEYLEFMHDRGYATATLWLSDGWDTVRANQWIAPLYWEQRDGDWWHFTLEGMQPVNEAEPVCHVSYYEADAFARWAGARLVTEFEWEVASQTVPMEGNFMDSEAMHPRIGPDSVSLSQMFGDVWEWTGSAYLAYPGYQPAAGAVGEYNGKFMTNQMVLRGGSCATPHSHLRRSYRNFFPPHARWQFMGIRLANGD